MDVQGWVEGRGDNDDTMHFSHQNHQQRIIFGPQSEPRVRVGCQQFRYRLAQVPSALLAVLWEPQGMSVVGMSQPGHG